MPTFRGFSTINQDKKFAMTDFELVKRDLLNAFLIREGTVPGRPDIGTNIWSFIFEPLDLEVRNAIENEVRKIIDMDPRTNLQEIDISYNHNTVIIEASLIVAPNASPKKLLFVFNQDTETLYIT